MNACLKTYVKFMQIDVGCENSEVKNLGHSFMFIALYFEAHISIFLKNKK